jgi:hypothetical protein
LAESAAYYPGDIAMSKVTFDYALELAKLWLMGLVSRDF